MSEKIPRGDVRKRGWTLGPKNWEDAHTSERDAQVDLGSIRRELAKVGVEMNTSKILEVGSGLGYLLKEMRKQNLDVVGIDARPRGVENNVLVGARVELLPFRDGTFDIVISENVFDQSVYNQNQKLMVEEIARVLKTEGVFYCGGSGDGLGIADHAFENGLKPVSSPEDATFEVIYKKV